MTKEEMKLYTDLEQSKKLAEILSIESADMFYYCGEDVRIGSYKAMNLDFDIPCWSIGALLSVLPFQVIANNRRFEFSMLKGRNKNGETYKIKYTLFLEKEPFLHLTDSYNNLVDACVEMILKLHELNLLK